MHLIVAVKIERKIESICELLKEKIKSGRGKYHTNTRSSLFQSTGQSDHLISDFERTTWSWMIGQLGASCWLPGTPVNVHDCPPYFLKPPNEMSEIKSYSVAWPCWRVQRLDSRCMDGWMTASGIFQPDRWGFKASEGYKQCSTMNRQKLL